LIGNGVTGVAGIKGQKEKGRPSGGKSGYLNLGFVGSRKKKKKSRCLIKGSFQRGTGPEGQGRRGGNICSLSPEGEVKLKTDAKGAHNAGLRKKRRLYKYFRNKTARGRGGNAKSNGGKE